MNLFARGMLVLCSLSFIGGNSCFDDYGNMWSNKNQPPGTTVPQKPLCLTDPPVGCYGVCGAPGADGPTLTPECSDVSAGPRTMDFRDEVMAQTCDPNMPPAVISPCQFDTTSPVEWPNQDHNICMTPPLPYAC